MNTFTIVVAKPFLTEYARENLITRYYMPFIASAPACYIDPLFKTVAFYAKYFSFVEPILCHYLSP
jgi:hypothetical protein